MSFESIEAKAGKRTGKGPPHVRVHRGFSRAGLIGKIGGPIPWTVYTVLLDFQNGKTGEAYPAVGTVAEATGLSDRSIQRAMRHLEDRGFIEAMTSRKGGRAKSVSYRVKPWETVTVVRPLGHVPTAKRVTETTVKGDCVSPERTEERERRIGLTPTAALQGESGDTQEPAES